MTEPLPPITQPEPTPRRRPSRNMLIAGVAVAAAVVGGAVWAVLANQSTTATAGAGTPSIAAPSTTPTVSPSKPAHGKAAGKALRGDVTSESGSTWTVQTRAGKAVTILITADTSFGTTKQPLTAAQIPVGTTVIITSSQSNGTIKATRVVTAAPTQPAPSPTTTS